MRVGFDAHMVGERETGNETYAAGLLAGFAEIDFPVDTYSFGSVRGVKHRNHRIWPRFSPVRIGASLPFSTLRDHLDLFHGTYVLPPLLPCPAVVTVHDITFALHPEWFPPSVARMLATLVPLALRQARRVITVSEHAKHDIVCRYGIEPEKIVVTYEAPRSSLARPLDLDGQDPFFLFVGNIQPRKNLQIVIQALRVLLDRGGAVPLVVAGNPSFDQRSIFHLVESLGLQDLVRFTGYVSDERLLELYASATALVHPALHEGFGLTPLEAMVQGTPVLVANTASLPEVVGAAGLLLPPTDVEAWADAMERILDDDALCRRLGEAGRERVSQFSWARCARETVEVYRAALQ